MAKVTQEEVLRFLNAGGGKTARELCARFSVSQPTMSRILSAAAGRIVPVGRGPRSRYFSAREKIPLPVFFVDESGFSTLLGRIFVLHGGFYFETENAAPALFGREFPDGFFDSLPWFIYEMRPQGYIGRAIARALRGEGFPPDPRDWSDDQILLYLTSRGEDAPGALVVGERSRARFLSAEPERVPESSRERAYPELAERAISVGAPGSSAAGEQPKFPAMRENADGTLTHVLVKFSGDRAVPTEERRADLLIAEFWAGETLRDAGFPAPAAELIFSAGRCFLESERIDRIGARGRRWTCSLASVEPALIGSGGGSWSAAARAGTDLGVFSRETFDKIVAAENFGAAIGNDDMHWGNLSFIVTPEFPFALAPLYDMSPMAYRVREDSSFPTRPLPLRAPESVSARTARDFWTRVAEDGRVSSAFREIARTHARANP